MASQYLTFCYHYPALPHAAAQVKLVKRLLKAQVVQYKHTQVHTLLYKGFIKNVPGVACNKTCRVKKKNQDELVSITMH